MAPWKRFGVGSDVGGRGHAGRDVEDGGGADALGAARVRVPWARVAAVTSFVPTSSPLAGGIEIVIVVSGFAATEPVSVQLAAVACVDPILDGLLIRCFAGATNNTASGPVVVTIGEETAESDRQFVYNPLPTITSVQPTSGPLGGGTVVIIEGANFGARQADLIYATLANVNCTSVAFISSTQIECIAGPTNTSVRGGVGVCTAPSGCGSNDAVQFTYNAPGGVNITILGEFGDDGELVSVTLDGEPCADAVRLNSTHIECIAGSVPSATAGSGPVLVTTSAGGISNANVLFTYLPNPIITTIAPTDAPLKGGTIVTISGSNLGPDVESIASLSIADVPCQAIAWVSTSELRCTAGSTTTSGRGPAELILVTGGRAVSVQLFNYRLPPAIEEIVPNNGPVAGETAVVITGEELGQDLQDIVSLTVAGVPCNNITYISISEVRCVTRQSPQPRSDVVLIETLSSGEIEEEARTVLFTYNQPPTTLQASPATGPESGGITVAIIGEALGQNEDDVVNVEIAGSSCFASLAYVNSSYLQCVLPPKPDVVTTDRVVVTTRSGGNGSVTASAQFTYTPTPLVTGIYPTRGATSGYTVVRLTGTSFGNSAADISDVLIAGVSCRFSLVYESPTSLSCFTGAAGEYVTQRQGNVTVITGAGGVGRSTVDFSYIPACYQATSESTCATGQYCYWCANTATCLSDQASCPIECSAGIISCAGLILILMQIVLLAVLTGGFFVIIYYVDRDEDLKHYLRKYSRRFKRADSDPEKRLGAQDPSLQ